MMFMLIAPPGFEPGQADSKSAVLPVTPQGRVGQVVSADRESRTPASGLEDQRAAVTLRPRETFSGTVRWAQPTTNVENVP